MEWIRSNVESRPSRSLLSETWFRLKKNPLAITGLLVIIGLFLLAIFGPLISGYSYYEQNLNERNLFPNMEHWFGTDPLGRDIFTRVSYGARFSLFIGIAAATLDFIIGVIYGGISGLKGGWVDTVMMRIAEALYGIPYLLTVILLSVFLGQGLWSVIIAMAITGWIPMARLVRGQVLQLKEQEYVQASRSFGGGTRWLLRKHIIPNTMGPILVNLTLTVPSAIFAEATLSFLGLGLSAPLASWGTMVNDGLVSLLTGYSYQLLIPAFFISLTMFAFNVLGDGLRDALDPRMRK